MKQLLIAKSTEALNTTSIASLNNGALCIVRLKDKAVIDGSTSGRTKLQAGKNVCIALGRPAGKGEFASGARQNNFIIPEVDTDTLSIVKASPSAGNKFSVVVALSSTTVDKVYALRFFKKGTVPHERNKYSVQIVGEGNTGSTTPTYKDSRALVKAINDMANTDGFNMKATFSTTNVTITGLDYTDWNVEALEELTNSQLTITNAVKPIGDAAYINDLAIKCAADKGHFYTHAEAREFIPGFPEDVETPSAFSQIKKVSTVTAGANGTVSDGDYIEFTGTTAGDYVNGHFYSIAVSGSTITPTEFTPGYIVYTLRFQVGRNSAKTRDEKVWQLVHIAVPNTSALVSKLDTIFADFM